VRVDIYAVPTLTHPQCMLTLMLYEDRLANRYVGFAAVIQ
jgi:hypothetical protein